MRYSVSQAAKIIGTSRQTIYRHIDSKPISVEKDENGNQYIEASELMRVYGSNINFSAVDETEVTPPKPSALHVVTNSESHNDLRVTEERLNSAQKEIDLMQAQSEREREQYDARIEYLEKALDKAQEGYNNVTKLLEDHSATEKRAGDWEKSMKSLEARISNQEKAVKEEQQKAQKILQQNRMLKKALEEERNKSFWQRLFG